MIRKIIKILKRMLTVLLILVTVIALIAVLFVNWSPEFGGKSSKAQKERFNQSKNYKNEKFINLGGVKMNMNFSAYTKMIREYLKSHPSTIPTTSIPIEKIDSLHLVKTKEQTKLVWFGHSTFLLQLDGNTILIDPMFGSVPAPHPALGTKRFNSELPIEIEKLPAIDAVLLSHDHYDHLDYGSIIKLKDKVKIFYTPLGVGTHLEAWGIPKEHIIELDWWEERIFNNLKFSCTPAQHFSGRGLTDGGATLWSSWVIQSDTENIFFSGDSGYGDHFKAIGDKYGPFDLALLECGQYNSMWSEIHMMPEETVQAGIDVKAKQIMPIHWGAFKLALHTWKDPAERISKKAAEKQLPVIFPKIGEYFNLDYPNKSALPWWQELE